MNGVNAADDGVMRVLCSHASVLVASLLAAAAVAQCTTPVPSNSQQQGFGSSSTFKELPPLPRYPVAGNSEVGILQFGFPVTLDHDVQQSNISFNNSELRVYLRLYCGQASTIRVGGFGGLYPSDTAFAATAYFYKQPLELQPHLKLSLVGQSSSGDTLTWPLVWANSTGSSLDMGLWPLIGPSNATGRLALQMDGSSIRHHIPPPACAKPSSSSSTTSSNRLVTRELNISGVWNVVTTTDPNSIPLQVYARLLLLHHKYHQRLGFNGTLLRCNQDEAPLLALMPQLQAEVAANRLIIWPWIWPGRYSTVNSQPELTPQPYFWQVPRNQLSMLAGYGRRLKLSYFDLDEYLVLPQGSSIQTAKCAGRPLLMEHSTAVWNFPRYAALCRNCTGEELICWEQANRHVTVTMTSAAIGDSTAESSITSSSPLQVTQCPCLLGKSLLQPSKVVNTKVHKTTPMRGYRTRSLDHKCAYLLHLQALVSSKRPWDKPWDRIRKNETLVVGQWVPGAEGSGTVLPDPGSARMLTGKECLAKGSELLRRCTQS